MDERQESARPRPDLMRYLYFRNPVQPIPLRADDPARGAAAPDRLRIFYKHLPLDSSCNPQMQKSLHPRACEAAEAAEAARELGGAEAFWKMHDALFSRPADLEQGRWADIASSAGLDGAAIAQRVAQHRHLDRIGEDLKLGYALKLRGTPASSSTAACWRTGPTSTSGRRSSPPRKIPVTIR